MDCNQPCVPLLRILSFFQFVSLVLCVVKRKAYTEAEITKRYADRFNLPILTANNYKKGIYRSFNEFKKIVSLKKFKTLYGDLYTGEGIQLSKVPQGFEKDNPASEYLKFKSWLVTTDIKDADLTSKDLVSKTVAAFGIMQPFVKFLNRPLE